MLIWSGFGFLVPVVAFLTLLVTEFSVEKITKNKNYYQENSWCILLGLVIAGAICFLISKYFDSKRVNKVYIDKETGDEIILKNKHTFIFVDIKYWPIVLPLLGLIGVLSTFT